MTRRILNTGGSANDGTGDSLRDASEKINANFLELYEVTKLEEGMSLEYFSNYVTNAIDSAFASVDLDGVVSNTHAINLIDVRLTGHDSTLLNIQSDLDSAGLDSGQVQSIIDAGTYLSLIHI